MSNNSSVEEEEMHIIFQMEEQSSGEDPPMSEWSSLVEDDVEENRKKDLYSKGLYCPGSGQLCTKFIAQTNSDIFRHPYYNYPAVHDPGIKAAILGSEKPVIYGDDGQSLYLDLCKEMNSCPVKLFYRNLQADDIDLSYYGVNPKGVRAMAMALQYNKFVQTFNLTDNHLNDDACYHLGQMLNSNTTLKELNLSGCRIGATGMIRLGETLHLNTSLNLLNLAKNNICEEGGIYFAKMISNGITVKRVNLSQNNLGIQSAHAIAEAFEYKDKITHLDLSWNNFYHEPTAKLLIEQMAQSNVLKEINLAWNALKGESVANAIKNVLNIPTLTILDLSSNQLKGEAIVIIVTNLVKAKKLITLDLSYNPLSPGDAIVVLETMLRPSVKLQNLLMDNVWVSKKFMAILKKVKMMKSRKNFVVTFGGVHENWTIKGADAREVTLRRVDYLCNLNKKQKVNIAFFFFALAKECLKPIPTMDLVDRCDADRIPIDAALISELVEAFPGPKTKKQKKLNLKALCEFMQRFWPEKIPPPSPPETEPELVQIPKPEPEPVPVPKKGKEGKK